MTEWGPAVREYETLKVEADRHPTMKGYIDIDVADDAIAELKVQLNVVRLDRDGQRKRAERAEAEVERLRSQLMTEHGYVYAELRVKELEAEVERLRNLCGICERMRVELLGVINDLKAEVERLTWMLDDAAEIAAIFSNREDETKTTYLADLARRWEQGADDRAADAWLGGEPH